MKSLVKNFEMWITQNFQNVILAMSNHWVRNCGSNFTLYFCVVTAYCVLSVVTQQLGCCVS